MEPKRIQRKRTKGWRMPQNTIYVGRGSSWGNPFVVGRDGTAEECIEKYKKRIRPYTSHWCSLEDYFVSEAALSNIIRGLNGKNLACWCKEDEPCHADWLLEVANDPEYVKFFKEDCNNG